MITCQHFDTSLFSPPTFFAGPPPGAASFADAFSVFASLSGRCRLLDAASIAMPAAAFRFSHVFDDIFDAMLLCHALLLLPRRFLLHFMPLPFRHFFDHGFPPLFLPSLPFAATISPSPSMLMPPPSC